MAMMGGGMGMRTIWITLRAVNYTERIFREVINDLVRMELLEKKLGQQRLMNLRIGNAMIMTGMMMAAVGTMMIQNLMNMAMATEKGAEEMNQLKQEMELAQVAFADAIYDILKFTGVLNMLHGLLAAMEKNKYIALIVGSLIILAGIVLVVVGGLLTLAGAMKSWAIVSELIPHLLAKLNVNLVAHNIVVNGAAISWTMLGVAMATAIGSFILVIAITDKFGKAAGMVVGLSMAVIGLALAFSFLKAVLTGGTSLSMDIASAVGVGLMAGGLMGVAYAGTRQMGTRGLPQTGMFLGHKGEVVYNPATRRPTQVANELEGDGMITPRTTSQDIDINIENLYTEASFDEIDEKLGRRLRKNMRQSR